MHRRAKLNVLGLSLLITVGIAVIPIGRYLLLQLPNEYRLRDAIRAKDASQVQKLLSEGVDPNLEMKGGMKGGTPLIWAAEKSALNVMKLLIKNGADVNLQDGVGNTALMWASTPQAAQLLLDAGANPLLRNNNGETASDLGGPYGSPQVIKLLKRASAKKRTGGK